MKEHFLYKNSMKSYIYGRDSLIFRVHRRFLCQLIDKAFFYEHSRLQGQLIGQILFDEAWRRMPRNLKRKVHVIR